MTLKLLKKKLHISLSLLAYCFTVFTIKGQSITIAEANILTQTDVTSVNQTIASLIIATGNLTVRASSTSFTNNIGGQPGLNLNVLKIKGRSIGGVTLGGSAEVSLAIADQNIYSGIGLLGNVNVDYRIPTGGTAWLAGTYISNLIYNVANFPYTITIPSYITPILTIPASIPIAINSFSQFRAVSGASSSNINLGYSTTVPTEINLRARSSSTFTFTPGFTSSLAFTPVNSAIVNASLTEPVGAKINITTQDQLLSAPGGLPITLNNQRSISTVYNISGANLRENFKNAGFYRLPITYSINKTAAFPIATTSKNMDSSLDVTVANMMDIQISSTAVALNFDNQTNYRTGVTTGVTNQVMVSSTVPYNITVKAGTAAFINSTDASSTIPLTVMTIEGMSGQTGVTPVVLSTNAQPIVNSGNPVIDRAINLQYRISAADVITNILGKSQGNYNATIIYTIVAP